MPDCSHSAIFLSHFIMFVAPRYKTARTLCSAAAVCNAAIGDGRVLPDANQIGSSIIQKSLSLCTAIAAVSVMIISSSVISKLRPF